MREQIAILGTGTTRFGELFSQSFDDLVREAVNQATSDASVSLDDVDSAWLSTAFPEIGVFKGRSGMDLCEPLCLYDIPCTRVSNFCASGADAVRNATHALLAHECDLALAVGVEKLRDRSPQDSLVKMMVEQGHPFYQKGFTAAGTFAIYARRWFHERGLTREDLAHIAVKNHHHGSLNDSAHYRAEISLEQALTSPMVADPLSLMDSCPTTDGASCIILARARDVVRTKQDPVYLRGMGLSISTGWDLPFFDPHHDFLSFRATQVAAEKAYRQAGITNPCEEIDLYEVHDCFSIVEALSYADLGLCKPEEVGEFIRSGVTRLGSQMPVNVSGGLLSCGHPVGATGIRMIAEVADQLRGRSGERQVKNARMGATQNIGGPGAIASVMILSKDAE